ncbi:DUF3375 domain-containing protein [Gordonia sp. (in: high G+C Gram-positive bacteria)]|uniref:DUF3375 domain-containing protein n=1 Tax=Gordonia sp. (in: high G+C Gram-positive bacteria) TaxID=84139 RepID=UPI001696D03E|nr:DUF3375 domain-containing protein [Gordonia sp. (in: high G+C Gram-positive bacteria)]NLG47912.1 DUF3375 domain-containing protein [Gordonia sp. (in: high G+C Gram-positive bacteria)]
MSAIGDVHQRKALREENPGWVLLCSANAATTLTLLGRHFRDGVRSIPAPELFDLLDADLEQLRDDGWDLPRSGQGYCADWVREGYLLRRARGSSREESIEPTEGTFAAMAFVAGLTSTTSTVTESRLTTLATQLAALARDTDPSVETRLARLQAERDEIDRQMAMVRSGDFPVLEGGRAIERSHEILSLASEIPGDFARVRTSFDELNRTLRARILDEDSDRNDTLGDVFRGVDLIGDSDAGRSFTGFYDTILDAGRSAQIDDAISTILDRPFAADLTAAERRGFRALLTDMENAAAEVHDTMTSLSRSLRHFVQSRAYEEHRKLQQLIRTAQQHARGVAQVRRPFDVLDLELVRVGMSIESVAALKPHNPADDRVVDEIEIHESGLADLAELRQLVRESEIDFDELAGNVAASLATRGRASVGDVLADHAATQGLASVVGLLVLAVRHGHPTPDSEDVQWTSVSGARRRATIVRHVYDPTAEEFAR